jgi:energy-coupling factor transport system ATP-binding protein
MIRFESVTVRYPDSPAAVLSGVDLHIAEGELCLVVGRTGSGKSTLLRTVNGLVPHFTGGVLQGRVTVGGRDTRTHRPRDLADIVGVVGQDPLAGFVTDVVEDELAYGMESLGLAAGVMRRRVEETLDMLGLVEVRDQALATLSAGQQQRVAIGSVLTPHPRVLVLDEPTSALDPPAAEEVLAALQRLVHDLGLTVLLAEHRLERVIQYADRIVHVPGGGRPVEIGPPADVMAGSPVVPPVVALGRLAGWSPLPLTIRDARRAATRPAGLAERLAGKTPPLRLVGGTNANHTEPLVTVRGLVARYDDLVALSGVDFTLYRGEVVAVMGRNGAGKSTLLASLVGLCRPAAGRVEITGVPPHTTRPGDLVQRVGLVPHEPGDLLYSDTVAAECAQADRDVGAQPGTCRRLFERLAPGVADDFHPRDLSEGQRLALAIAVVLAGAPPVLLLDEPTRGLDYIVKARLVALVRQLAAEGHAVVLATHDVELAAEVATRTVVLADGEIVADGPTVDVITSSPAFAPQVAKVLAPQPWLTVADVAAALGAAS